VILESKDDNVLIDDAFFLTLKTSFTIDS